MWHYFDVVEKAVAFFLPLQMLSECRTELSNQTFCCLTLLSVSEIRAYCVSIFYCSLLVLYNNIMLLAPILEFVLINRSIAQYYFIFLASVL